MTPTTRNDYLMTRNLELARSTAPPSPAELGALRDRFGAAGLAMAAIDRAANFRNGMALEREFVAAGGLLLAGPDPTGDGGVLPGYGDQREVELLVDAGFTPVEAIRIATLNGATYLGRADTIGSVAPGKNADLIIVKGDPSKNIADIENTEIIFKDGIGYNSQKLLDATKGRYGQY